PRLAGPVMEDEAPRRRQVHLEPRQRRRHGVEIGLEHDRELLAVEPAQQRLGAVAGDELAMVDDGDGVAELLRLLEVMRGEEDGDAGALQAPDMVPKTLSEL